MIVHAWNAPFDLRVTRDIEQALASCFTVEVDRKSFRGDRRERVLSGIRWASLVISVVDAVSLNVAFEVGYAVALGRPLVLIQPGCPTVDVQRYFEPNDDQRPSANPELSFNDDWTDVKDTLRCITDFSDPDAIKTALSAEFVKIDEHSMSLSQRVLDSWLGHLERGIQDREVVAEVRRLLEAVQPGDMTEPLLGDSDQEQLASIIEEHFDPQRCLHNQSFGVMTREQPKTC